MEVILLERVAKLGQMGEVVRVRDGFGRNYLLARGKALRATEENRKRFESQKIELETRNLELKSEADAIAASTLVPAGLTNSSSVSLAGRLRYLSSCWRAAFLSAVTSACTGPATGLIVIR